MTRVGLVTWTLGAIIIVFAAKVAWDAAPELRSVVPRDAGADASTRPPIELDPPAGSQASNDASAIDLNALVNGAHPGEGDAGRGGLDEGGVLPPGSRPKQVRFGVVLVQFAGAQGATTTRSRDAALRLATDLTEEAKRDFKAAVARGDSGSIDDAGRIQRGVLEASVEEALFSLPVGEIPPSPVETPRGYWIVKRLE